MPDSQQALTATPPRFYAELRGLVFQELRRRGLRHDGGAWALWKTAALFVHVAFWYAAWLLAISHGFAWAALATPPLVLAVVFIVTGAFHDASHGALHKSRLVNGIGNCFVRVFGGSAMSWRDEHVVQHHGHTNVYGLDHDLESGGFMRFHPAQAHKGFHRFQHLYAWFLYGAVILRWLWVEDFNDWARNPYRKPPRARAVHALEIFGTKLFHAFAFIVVPCAVGGVATGVGAYLFTYALIGMSLATTFVVAHLSSVQQLAFARSELPEDWGQMQVMTTANFGVHQAWLTFLIGGLNHQIEHHLFPTISHRHYPLISRVVRAFCEARAVPYLEFPSFPAAIAGHYRHLKRLGSERPLTHQAAQDGSGRYPPHRLGQPLDTLRPS